MYFWPVFMKSFFNILLILLWMGLAGCDQQEDCIGCNLNPKIKINLDVQRAKEQTDSLLTNVKDSINILSDSLSNALPADVKAKLTSALQALQDDSLMYENQYALLRVGQVQVLSIEAQGGAPGFEQFQDSIFRNFSIPVDMHHDTSTYYFDLMGQQDTLELVYKRDIAQTLDGVRMSLSDIGINNSRTTFDSVSVKCYNSTCSNDLTTVYIYF